MPRPAAYSSKSVRACETCSSEFAGKIRIKIGPIGPIRPILIFRFKQRQEKGSPPSPIRNHSQDSLRGERRTASATAGCIRILEGEARTHHATHVVDLDAVQILCAEHIDKHAHAL